VWLWVCCEDRGKGWVHIVWEVEQCDHGHCQGRRKEGQAGENVTSVGLGLVWLVGH